MNEILYVINHSIMITLFVFVMMLLVDYINVSTKGRMEKSVKGGKGRQYTMTSFLGSTPGCLGAFMNVSFYVHGLIGFGAIVGGMIATSGDEAFVMLALFPKEAVILFAILFILGIFGGWLSDKFADRIRFIPCKECELQVIHDEYKCKCFEPAVLKKFSKYSSMRYAIALFLFVIIVAIIMGQIGPETWNWVRITILIMTVISTFIILTVPDHYLEDHIWKHIIKKHIWRVYLWTFFALLFITFGLKYWDIETFIKSNIAWVFIICALVGMIPESGPHMVFVMMFASGIVPFSILLTSSIVQDGHGMLPLFSYSMKDALMIKTFNLVFAIVIGLPLLLIGI